MTDSFWAFLLYVFLFSFVFFCYLLIFPVCGEGLDDSMHWIPLLQLSVSVAYPLEQL